MEYVGRKESLDVNKTLPKYGHRFTRTIIKRIWLSSRLLNVHYNYGKTENETKKKAWQIP